MADNYLEKRMEDYRRSGGGGHAKQHGVGRQGMVCEKIVLPRIMLLADLQNRPDAADIVTRMAVAGCKVAFTHPNFTQGQKMAQRTSGLFVPNANAVSLYETMRERWGGVDMIIFDDSAPLPDELVDNNSRRLVSLNVNPSELAFGHRVLNLKFKWSEAERNVAQFCLFLSLQSGACIAPGQTVILSEP